MKTAQCPKHPRSTMVVFCPACRGSVTSPRKAKSSARNGKKGGRPRTRPRKRARTAA